MLDWDKPLQGIMKASLNDPEKVRVSIYVPVFDFDSWHLRKEGSLKIGLQSIVGDWN